MNESRAARTFALAARPGSVGEGVAAALALVRIVGDVESNVFDCCLTGEASEYAEFVAGYVTNNTDAAIIAVRLAEFDIAAIREILASCCEPMQTAAVVVAIAIRMALASMVA